MPQLFVANCSRQNHDFLYRIPEEGGRIRVQSIPIGGQARIHNEAPVAVLKSIIDQHERYGLVDVKAIPRTKPFIGLCYSIGEPVNVGAIMTAAEHNDNVLMDLGLQIRKEAAIATDQSIRQDNPGVNHFEVQVTEELRAGASPNDDRMEETIEVTTSDAANTGDRRARRRR